MSTVLRLEGPPRVTLEKRAEEARGRLRRDLRELDRRGHAALTRVESGAVVVLTSAAIVVLGAVIRASLRDATARRVPSHRARLEAMARAWRDPRLDHSAAQVIAAVALRVFGTAMTTLTVWIAVRVLERRARSLAAPISGRT